MNHHLRGGSADAILQFDACGTLHIIALDIHMRTKGYNLLYESLHVSVSHEMGIPTLRCMPVLPYLPRDYTSKLWTITQTD